jgi:Transport and Golgi organisation 2
MCTVSWLRQPDGYVLFCNRDERLTRKTATGPRQASRNGVFYIAPVDGDFGGSWIGVNQLGLTTCLLNQNAGWSADPNQNYTSRGLLLTSLLDARAGKEVYGRLLKTELRKFPPFMLAVLSIDQPLMQIDWTGRELLLQTNGESGIPLTSSSRQHPEIVATRNAEFRRLFSKTNTPGVALLDQFHHSHLPERGPLSVCMHREDAATVSMSVITVGSETIEFFYHPTSPCLAAMPESVMLKRTDPVRGRMFIVGRRK